MKRPFERFPLLSAVLALAVGAACLRFAPALGAPAMLLLVLVGAPERLRLRVGARGSRRSSLQALALAGAVAAVGVAAGVVGRALAPSAASGSVAGPTAFLLLLGTCLLTAVFEETLFRGVLFPNLTIRARCDGMKRPELVGAAVSSLAFACLHAASAPPGLAAVKVIESLLFACLMCVTLKGSGTLWLPVAVHAVFNLGYLGSAALAGAAEPAAVCIIGTALLALIAAGAALYNGRSQNPEGER